MMATDSQTIACRLTGPGRSAVAVLGLRGPGATECVENCFKPASKTDRDFHAGEVRYGVWRSAEDASSPGESIVLTPVDDDWFEIHGHGGEAAVDGILSTFVQHDIRIVDTATWLSLQESRNGTSSIIIEAEFVLQKCVTASQAAVAMDQMRGHLVDWCEAWMNRLNLGDPDLETLRLDASILLQRSELGLGLTRTRQLVLAGPPNVGKSSLMNRIVGFQRSITHDMAGTTRDVLQSDTVVAGVPVRLSDTAGIRDTQQLLDAGASIEREGIRRATDVIQSADIVLVVTEPARLSAAKAFRESLNLANHQRVIEVLNKSDALAASDASDATLACEFMHQTVATSPDDAGVLHLMETIGQLLQDTLPPRQVPVPLCERQQNVLERLTRASLVDEASRDLVELLDREIA